MPIVTTDIPITSQRNLELIRQITDTYPFVRSQVIGTTAFGRPIPALVVGTGPRKVLYTASHHANEWITSYILLKFAEELAAAIASNGRVYGVPAKNIAAAATIYLVPLVDPDGVDPPAAIPWQMCRRRRLMPGIKTGLSKIIVVRDTPLR